ncbi:hypothetical protein TthAA37_25620 (plasmid) [Thermus thermophilus]|uniref:Uncharacterized protein n=1 Tax=Thermus scotoductus TaxID=37636 RepID=A0A430S281_THESC|nr:MULTISPECIES: hypothetical protein [Thermus]RTG91701.1 hypothetical protein CSW51_12895 [Thermus scotoductus]RTH04956.1 hypothetical protein CSW50_01485 [Thermus scotoductus]RTH27808.1 hypothetical protein CSW40_02180 [Thermus scotoductus]RTH28285.1 hypothetical protein CSW38_01405 [Thermus scotoductus]RTI41945.1 hypothetical protein CSW18_02400 [Thermus scotoductus]
MRKQDAIHALGRLLTLYWPLTDEVGLGDLLRPYLPDKPAWTEEEITAALARLLADVVAEGWDRHGAPSVARHPTEGFVASFEGPGGPYTVEATSKREAYREARREWVYRLLTRS